MRCAGYHAVTPTPFVVVALIVGLAACGNKAAPPPSPEDAAGPALAPLVLPQLGIDHIRRMGFVYGDGWSSYDKAVAAIRGNDAAAAQRHAEASIAKDPFHLDAHYLLARLLARGGEHAAAVDHLVLALTSDHYYYGPKLEAEADLAEFRATAHGQAVAALSAKIRDGYAARVPEGLWLVARRSRFKWPRERGNQYASSRGELYAYDRPTKRFFRLTHTNHKVVAYARALASSEIAVVGFDKLDRPKSSDKVEPTVRLTAAWIERFDATTWQPIGKKISLPPAHTIAIGYAPGDQLVVATTDGTTTTQLVQGDELVASEAALPASHVAFTLDQGAVVHPIDGVTAAWTGEPATAPTLAVGSVTLAIPESGAASRDAVALAPGGARLAFATAVDPCNEDSAPSLYVADTARGTLRHVLTARSRFAPRWIDADHVAYEDGDNAIRIWDAATGRQAYKIENKPGIGLAVLSLAPARRCVHTEDPADDGGGEPDEPPMPPEEPVTMPR